MTQLADFDATTQDVRRDFKRARGSVLILKRARVGGDGGEKVFRNRFVERQVLALEQLEKNLARRGRDRIDVHKIAVARIARVMIDVDPNFRAADGGQGVVAQALPGRGVEREDDVEILRFVRRERDHFAARQEGKFLEQTFFVPNFDFFAQLPECETHRDLTAESVPIRPDVTEDNEALVFAQNFRDFRER